jgi:hypothetical protein
MGTTQLQQQGNSGATNPFHVTHSLQGHMPGHPGCQFAKQLHLSVHWHMTATALKISAAMVFDCWHTQLSTHVTNCM